MMSVLFRLIYAIGALFIFIFGQADFIWAAQTSSQIVGSQTQHEINTLNNQTIENKIYQTPNTESSPNLPQEEPTPTTAANNQQQKFFVKTIDVQGATIPSNLEILKVLVPYEGTMMSLADAQKVADLITDIYRKKGFITSRAYIPPQTLRNKVLMIKVIEGKLGTVDVKGNKYFKTSLVKKELNLTQDGYFDYSALQKSLVYINQHPDRVASTILAPGQKQGTTDVLVNVKDQLPIHAGFIYDNYGSRYIDSDRYALTLEDNNLLGLDDRMFAKVQTSDSHYMRLGQLQYVVPVTETLNIGAYGLYSHLRLTKEFAALQAIGTAKVLGLFFDKALVQNPGFEWRINGGFDYKNISNNELGTLISRDKERVLKLGTELDITDHFGRTIINPEIDVGLPNIFNGMDPKDGLAARAGSGGSFQKWDISAYRLQPLPFDTSLLWKNTAQWSHDTLPSAEEFELGGPTSVRGYEPAEYSGDKGLYSSLEWSVPPYFIPDYTKVPFTQLSLKDCLRLVAFYDFGFAHLNSVAVGEEKNTTLRAYGYGIRLNVRDNLTVRFEVGYPLGRKSADGSNAQPWIEVTAKY
jgi:hemolysin activation/secretion protein